MASTFLGLEIGKRSLQMHQKSLNVIGHNLANIDNEAYSRQRVTPGTLTPLYDPSLNRAETAGQIGQGAEIISVKRDRDIHLDVRITAENANNEFWTSRKDLINQVEDIHDSLGDVNLQERLDKFWSGWQELSKNPSEPAVRESLKQDAISLTRGLNQTFSRLDDLRHELNDKIISEVDNINKLSASIAALNNRIVESEALGDNPNDVLDKRDALVERLSSIVDVRASYKDHDELMVFIGGKMLVQGDTFFPLTTVANQDNDGLVDVKWKMSGDALESKAGRISAYLTVRDDELKNQIRNIDAIANNLTFSVNRIHREGFNNYNMKAGNFFVENYRGTDSFGNFDRVMDDKLDSTLIYQVAGKNKIDPQSIVGEAGTLTFSSINGDKDINVSYTSDERISDLLKRINQSSSNVNAYVDNEGYLVFKARSSNNGESFAIRHLEDSGNFLSGVTDVLASSGPNGAFDYSRINEYQKISGQMDRVDRAPERHAAGWIALDNFILKDVNRIAAADGTDYDGVNGKDRSFGNGDGSLAESISSLRFDKIMIDEKPTFNEYYAAMISDLAAKGDHANLEIEKHEALLGNLKDVRESISGVNIDEEMAEMLAMQHGYKAAARVVTMMDSMLDTIINRMGVG